MRRVRSTILLLTVLALLVGPTSTPARGQVNPEEPLPHMRVEALITGQTVPNPANPIPVPTGRSRGEGEFDQNVIIFALECRPDGSSTGLPGSPNDILEEEIVVGSVTQPAPTDVVSYRSDDDLTDGNGEVNPTGTPGSGDFDTSNPGNPVATEIRVGGLDPAPARATFHIEEGRFDRIANVVIVELFLNIRIDRNPGGPNEQQVCHAHRVPFRIVFALVPAQVTVAPPGVTNFQLVGIGRGTTGDSEDTSLDRKICDTLSTAGVPGVGGADQPCGFHP